MLFPGCETGGDLGGKIFPKLLPPGEPTKPFTGQKNKEVKGHFRRDGKEIVFIAGGTMNLHVAQA